MLHRQCTRVLEFDAAHRVLRHESKCATLHGHRYKLEVTCESAALDDVGRVIDFGVVKQVFGQWVDNNLDHTTIVNSQDADLLAWAQKDWSNGKRAPYVFPGEPTAENLAEHLLHQGQKLLAGYGVKVSKIRVYETPNCWADYEAQ